MLRSIVFLIWLCRPHHVRDSWALLELDVEHCLRLIGGKAEKDRDEMFTYG